MVLQSSAATRFGNSLQLKKRRRLWYVYVFHEIFLHGRMMLQPSLFPLEITFHHLETGEKKRFAQTKYFEIIFYGKTILRMCRIRIENEHGTKRISALAQKFEHGIESMKYLNMDSFKNKCARFMMAISMFDLREFSIQLRWD